MFEESTFSIKCKDKPKFIVQIRAAHVRDSWGEEVCVRRYVSNGLRPINSFAAIRELIFTIGLNSFTCLAILTASVRLHCLFTLFVTGT